MLGTFLLVILALCIVLVRWTQSYWSRQGVTEIKPQFFTGNVVDIVSYKKSWGQLIHEFYNELKNKGVKYGGIYFFLKPTFLPLDPDLIKDIMVNNSHCFANRGLYFNEEYEPISANIVALEGKAWKNLRHRLLPTFAPNQLQKMFQSFNSQVDKFKSVLISHLDNNNKIDIQELSASFATDVLVSCLFGVNSKCMDDPKTDFHQHGRKIAELTWQKSLTLILAQLFPRKLCGILGMRFTDKKIQDFFLDIARTTIDYREKNNINRMDLIHAMNDVKDQNDATDEKKYIKRLNDTAAQCFVAFIAAHETTATVLKFALFEISFSPKVQDILRNEIQTMVRKYNDDLSYECLSEMEYLEGVVLETLRKYPVCPVLLRSCNKTYQVPNTNITLKPGSLINIPVLALHMDPQYHPNPHEFIPDRFSSENRKLINESTFLPFGIGPRGCLGYKFGKLIVKAAIIEIVRNYQISLDKNVKTPLELGPNSFFVTTKDKVWVNLTKL